MCRWSHARIARHLCCIPLVRSKSRVCSHSRQCNYIRRQRSRGQSKSVDHIDYWLRLSAKHATVLTLNSFLLYFEKVVCGKCCFSKMNWAPSGAGLCVFRGTNVGCFLLLFSTQLDLGLLYLVTSAVIGLLTLLCKVPLSRAVKEYFTEESNIWTVFWRI